MTCELAQRALSAMADGEAPDADPTAVADHLGGCPDCQAFDATIRSVRQRLRLEPVGPLPDLAPTILARLATRPSPRRWRMLAPAAAAAVVGAVAGATYVGLGSEPDSLAAADLADRVVAVQPAVSSLTATITVTETGGTTWRGTLAYRAPESLAVVLTAPDGTVLATVADADRWWATGRTGTRAVERRAPFDDGAPAPLELVSPVDSLADAAAPVLLGSRTVAGLPAIGVEVSAGQVAQLFRGLDPNGGLRPVHPTDIVELWLDETHLVPLELVVRVAASPERLRWAAAHGLRDEPGAAILDIALDDIALDGPLPADAFPPAPAGASTVDGAFVDDDGAASAAPRPDELPAGLEPGRSGRAGDVAVRTWSDGRAWLAVRATEAWQGNRLFGALGSFVVPVDLGAAGTAYADPDGTAIALHADGLDVLVEGSVGAEALRDVASSLGIVGRPVPDDWAEAATATLADAVSAAPDLLVLPDPVGFGEPAARIAGGIVTLRYTGPGDLAIDVVRGELPILKPPLDPDVVAVRVRGVPGRYRAASGDLEWVEGGRVRVVRGPALGLDELLGIAARLEEP